MRSIEDLMLSRAAEHVFDFSGQGEEFGTESAAILPWPERLHTWLCRGGPFASVQCIDGRWFVVWWVGPCSRTLVPSEGKGRAWVERFAERRLEALGRLAATPGTGPYGRGGGYVQPTAEEQARYDAFSTSYVPPKRSRKRSR